MRRLLIVLLLLLAQPAQAQEYSATVSPETVVFGRDSQVTWRITIKTDDKPLDADLALNADAVSPAQHGTTFGFPVTGLGDVRLEGLGSVRQSGHVHGDPCWAFIEPLPLHGQRFLHGINDYGAGGQRYYLEMPANAESVLVVSTPMGNDAPWPGTTYGLDARVDGTALNLPRAGAGNPLGVPLSFTTDPPAGKDICGKRPRFSHGPVKVTGRTDPALSGDRVTVIDAQSDATRTVGEATVQPDGTFVLDGWKPAPGDHTVAVRYVSQRPDRTDDFAAPQWFATDSPPPPPAPPQTLLKPPAPLPQAAPEVLGTSRAAAGFVTVRLKCKSAGGCRGVARLSRKGRRVAARRYDMADGATARLRMRLPARTWRSLRRRGRLAMEVQLDVAGGRTHSEAVTLLRR